LINQAIIVSILSLGNTSFAQEKSAASTAGTDKVKSGSWKKIQCSKVANTKYGDVNIRIYIYVRYLNQLGLDSSYTNDFGHTSAIDQRQDVQVQKVSIYFSGWFLDPKFRYFLYAWACKASQGLGAQVVLAGNLVYNINRHFALRDSIMSLPGVRTSEGNYPFWLSVDNRMIGDEFYPRIIVQKCVDHYKGDY
jgi:hypothetical protein